MTEAQLQRAVARVLDASGLLWQHTPNEGQRSERYGHELKRQGLKRGVPDVLIYTPPTYSTRGPAFGLDHGIAIELKVGRNTTTPEQDEWMLRLRECGWRCAVCRSLDEVLALLEECYGIGH